VTRVQVVNQRVVVASMETRAICARYDADTGRWEAWMGTQGAHTGRARLAAALDVDPARIRVHTPDVGGGFGMKLMGHPEHGVVCLAAQDVGRPVRWSADRSEAMLSDAQGRDMTTDAEAAFDADGRLLAFRWRTVSNLDMEQAQQLALGAEAVAISILQEEGADFGNFQQDIADGLAYEANIGDVSIGLIRGQLQDVQGRLNLNNLVLNGTVNEPAREQFQRLFELLEINPSMVDLLIDWIDPDTVPFNSGAEDGSYTGLDPPYRPANNYFLDVSELRAIGGMEPEMYEALLPHVVALPPGWCGGQPTRLNLNFATPEVIAAVTEVSPGIAVSMAEQRDETPWETVDEVGLPEDTAPQILDYIDVRTDCFSLSVIVNVGSSTLTMYSLLDRAAAAATASAPAITRVRAYGLEN